MDKDAYQGSEGSLRVFAGFYTEYVKGVIRACKGSLRFCS